jgi:tetratricopeptide (TPR) repeat protein
VFVNIATTLQDALNALRAGSNVAAERHLVAILGAQPHNADGLQLLGMVRKSQGRIDQAQELLRASLASRPHQPHVLNNLANLLGPDERGEAALLYREAIKLNPNYTEAMANLAGVLLADNRLDQARQEYESALAVDPNHVQSVLGMASLLLKVGQLDLAQAYALQATKLAPQNATAHGLLGDVLAARHEYEGAIVSYEQALSIGPQTDVLWAALGGTLRYALRDQDAFTAFARALQCNPGNILAHRNLNGLLWTYGRQEKYLDSYRTMLPLVPQDVEVRLAFYEDLLRHGDVDQARATLGEVALLAPDHSRLAFMEGRLAFKLGDFDKATALFERATNSHPNDSEAFVYAIDSLLKASQFVEAVHLAKQALDRFPGDQDILARIVAAQKLSGSSDIAGLWDTQNYVRVVDLVPPDGRSMEDFNGELGDYLRTLHLTTTHPIDQTLRGGTQTFGNLLSADKTAIIATLKSMFRAAIADYIAGLPTDVTNPVARRVSKDFDFAGSWSARLLTNGFHTNHIHPKGWLSSAYYVALPPHTNDSVAKSGWFKLGQTNMALGDNDVPTQLIEPRVGRLVLFPSYYWHGTTPFNEEAERLTVAFDVIPK